MSAHNRSGLMHSFLVALIILLISFGLVIMWLIRAGIIVDDEADVNLCRATLAIQAKTQLGPDSVGDFDSPFSSVCKRRVIEIGPDSVTVRGNGKFSLSRPLGIWAPKPADPNAFERKNVKGETTEAVAQSVLAESLRRCWTLGIEGDMKVFEDRSIKNQNVCLVCDEIHVDRGASSSPIPRAPSSTTWLAEYLEKTTMPGTRTGQPTTYAAFLDYVGAQSEDDYPRAKALRENRGIAQDYPLSDGTYATILLRRFGEFGGGWATTAVVPTSKLRILCKYVAN